MSKLKFDISSVISENNINLAIMEDIKYTSSDVVKVTKYTNLYNDNIIAIFSDFIKASVNDSGKVNIFNEVDDIIITNETFIDEKTLDLIPLWYVHSLKKVYMNITLDNRDMYVNIPDNIIDNLIPADSNLSIVKNTVKLFRVVNNSNIFISSDNYKVDIPNKRIIITNEALLNSANGKYRIVYDVFIPDIIIEDKYGNIIENNKYVIEAHKISGSDTLFNVNILTWFKNTDDNIYYVKYNSFDNNNQIDISEILRVYNIYKKTDDYNNIIDRNDRYYYINDNYDIETKLTKYDTVYIRYNIENNEYIEIKEPDSLYKNIAWYINIRAGKFTDSNSGLVYDIIERNKYNLKDNERIVKTSIRPIFINDTTLKLYHKNLYVSMNNKYEYTNIHIYSNDIEHKNIIENVDIENGIIYLNKILSTNNDIVVEYKYRTKYISYEYINVNPLAKYKDNENIINKQIVLYMLPSNYLNKSLNRSVFHKIVYKNPSVVKNIKDEEINVLKSMEYIIGLDDNGKSNIYNEVKDYIINNAPDDLKPIILGYVNINQIVHEDSYDFNDIRQYALYVNDIIPLNKLLDANNDVINYCDIALYDGKIIRGNKVIIVNITKELFNKIKYLFEEFDTDTIYKTRNNPDYIYIKTKQFIEEVIKKYFKVGTYFKFIYEI